VLERLAEEGIAEAQRLDAERKALNDCLQKLQATERDLIRRCYDPGATIKQVAEQTGRTPNSLYKLLNRIRESLLRCIELRLTGID
jgi:RNA polymerase sigma-70 factor (ECF subfamily)